jgi:nucleotide-binding universal stress UspA family protein
MQRFTITICLLLLAALFAFAPAHAEKRVALIVGNDRYANLPDHEQLRKAANDARAVGESLRQIGFDVIVGENLGRAALVDRFADLTQRLSPGDTAFFFFSGHGVALDGVNYILPADVPDLVAGQAGQETRLKGAALAEQYIVSELAARGVRVAVVVLDACRTNPFARSGAKGVGGDKGLSPPPQVKGVFSLYAASGGQAARDRLSDDDPSPNSVFTRVLAPALMRPGVDLATLAIEVREEVARIAQAAGYDQRPSYYDETIGGRVYLAGLPAAGADGEGGASTASVRPSEDEVAWRFLKDIGNADQLRFFIAQYPASPRRREAEERLKSMEEPDVAVAQPAPSVESEKPHATTCNAQAADRKLWGRALIDFMTKCEETASTSCAAQADERQILPVIRLLFIRRCVTEALGG